MAFPVKLIHLELLLTLVGLCMGFVGFIAFTFCLHLYTAGLLALYSGILACIAFHIHRLHWKNSLADWYTIEMMDCFKLFGLVGVLIGLAFVGWNVFWQIYHRLPIVPILKSVIVPFGWAAMTLLFGGVLLLAARKYSNMTEENQSLLSHTYTGRRY